MKTLDIYTVFDNKTLPFAEALFDNINLQLSNNYITTFRAITIENLASTTRWDIVASVSAIPGMASKTHASALQLIPKLATADYLLITDADVAVLANNFDELLIEQLRDNCAVIGAYRIGDDRCAFPSVFFSMFDGGVFRSLPIDFMPDDDLETICVVDKIMSRRYGLLVGSKLVKDTGYKLKPIYSGAGYLYKELPVKSKKAGYSLAVYSLDDTPIVSHFAGSRLKFKERYNKWLKIINKYTKTYEAQQ